MNYFRQILTVTIWEYKRFYKIKNELIGILVLIVVAGLSFSGTRFAVEGMSKRQEITLLNTVSPALAEIMAERFDTIVISKNQKEDYKKQLVDDKEGMLLWQDDDGSFRLFGYRRPSRPDRIRSVNSAINQYVSSVRMAEAEISQELLESINEPAELHQEFIYEPGRGRRHVMAFFFAGFMTLAIFSSFAYQFTGITGEKQTKVTEQIVSAIKPQVWMDGKIFGITLTGLSSILTYAIISVLGGMVWLIFSGTPTSVILDFLYLPALLLFFAYTLLGILMWNAVMAAIAAIITDPNNSGKSGLMMLPSFFVFGSMLVLVDPDGLVAKILSWFPLTSASAMPMRWVATEVAWWEIPLSYALLFAGFYFVRKLAARIFRVTILIGGKEPTWGEVIRLMRES